MLELNEVLIPVDFSESSNEVVREAMTFLTGEAPVAVLQHVLDPALAEFAESIGLQSREHVLQLMRRKAETQLHELAGLYGAGIEVVEMVSEGTPFFEVIRVADELDVDAVIMGKAGKRIPGEALLFGSTAERVIRGCRKPVIVLPLGE